MNRGSKFVLRSRPACPLLLNDALVQGSACKHACKHFENSLNQLQMFLHESSCTSSFREGARRSSEWWRSQLLVHPFGKARTTRWSSTNAAWEQISETLDENSVMGSPDCCCTDCRRTIAEVLSDGYCELSCTAESSNVAKSRFSAQLRGVLQRNRLAVAAFSAASVRC